jgi:two-component system cell cycle response regulator DivK
MMLEEGDQAGDPSRGKIGYSLGQGKFFGRGHRGKAPSVSAAAGGVSVPHSLIACVFLQSYLPFGNESHFIFRADGRRRHPLPPWHSWRLDSTMAKTVLVVEDNELNMKLFHDLLEANGYNIVQTRSGLEAIDLAREHHPDLILMDIQLPEVSGLEVTKWIKEDDELRAIPVIAVTAFAMKGDEERIRQGGCEAYLSKPISVTTFLETVKNYIGEA